MKTPDEIKKGLEHCYEGICSSCPYMQECDEHLAQGEHMLPADVVLNDFLSLIKQLERERDELLADLTLVCGSESINPCLVCGHYRTDWEKPGCELNGLTCIWSWRGVQKNDQDREN